MRIRAKIFADYWQNATKEEADKQTFWNEFFEIFGVQRKSLAVYEQQVKRLGRAAGFIDLFWPGTLIVEHKSLGESLDYAYNQAGDYAANLNPAEQPQYIIVSDFQNIKLYDLVGDHQWSIDLDELPTKLDLFGFIAGYHKQEYLEQHPVDIKASKQLTQIHDELRKTGYLGEDLEILLVRLLFCMFAEDNGVFDKRIFYEYLYDRTSEDASDLGPKLIHLFQVLDQQIEDRQSTLDEYLQRFPYVNGGLFKKSIATPTFDHNMRHTLLDAARNNDWDQINPAIFGAMFQNVMQESGPKKRRELGAHYTSEANILKVIKPLFLDDLRSEFESSKHQINLLNQLHEKISRLKFLDPACGCGNFLVVAYRELRRLELDILKIIYGEHLGDAAVNVSDILKCSVDQFYGIEIEEFPTQVAQVAMWLTDAQMNKLASDQFHTSIVRLPLAASATIVHGDALEKDWNDVISPTDLNYLFGNPPFSGGKQMSQEQRDQVRALFPGVSGAGVLDFVAGWYAKAMKYIQGTKIRTAFVSTNSIVQGEQVGILWEYMTSNGAIINFAHRTFKWGNESGGTAAVYCVIIGFWLEDSKNKMIYEYATSTSEPLGLQAKHINAYLMDFEDIYIHTRQQSLSDAPKIGIGNQPIDGGFYLFTTEEKDEFIYKEPGSEKFFRKWIGGEEFLNNTFRWCLWLGEASPSDIRSFPNILKRIEMVRDFRLKSKRSSTLKLAQTPTRFQVENIPKSDYLVIPELTPETRQYIPIGFMKPDTLASNLVKVVQNVELSDFGVLTSEMHMCWVRYVAGRMGNGYRYSKDIVYNNFPWPNFDGSHRSNVEQAARNILSVRSKYTGNSLADLYDVLTMPPDLLKAHRTLDKAVDKAYRTQTFRGEDERIKYLFELYKRLSSE